MPESNEPIIRLEGLCKRFNGLTVLDNLTLEIDRARTTVIIGPSGCGKTVLLKHLVGLLRPDSGKVFFDGVDITHMSEAALAPIRGRMGFLFQSNALFDSMTVAENIHFPLIERGVRSPEQLATRCREVLRLVGLDGLQQRYPEELSGGQQKRVALARAISLKPEVILYDEPTTGLDPIRADLINELILKLQAELQTTALVVTHDMRSACKVADRIIMLYDGRVLADTTPDGLTDIEDETVSRFVEGRATVEELNELTHGSATQGSDDERTDA
ncbi:hypothetical protein LCGC14_2005670 [marine sediment metagenome]|uniref:ABC transporter domain-containing protein n=1 Tax=marine sediment metagenome TaxID=412755 RepID=A0A0F9F1Y4_9ZZZZ